MKAIRPSIGARRSQLICVLLALLAANRAFAQTAPAGNPWSHGTTLNGFVGAATASSDTGPAVGGAVGWEVTRWFGIEGSAAWLDRRNGADAFAADLKALVNLAAGSSVIPFLDGGIGLYRASFDLSRGTLPDFYQGRVTTTGAGLGSSTTFTDPSFIVGAGVNLFVSSHVAVRPDVQAAFVRRDSQTYVVASVAVHVAYHIEEHPRAPFRRR